MISLADKLLEAGLVSKADVNKVKREKAKKEEWKEREEKAGDKPIEIGDEFVRDSLEVHISKNLIIKG